MPSASLCCSQAVMPLTTSPGLAPVSADASSASAYLPVAPRSYKSSRQVGGSPFSALYAIRIGMRPEGVREWNYSTNLHVRGGMDDRGLLAAADLACQHEVWDRCINTSERTRTVIDSEQRFPMPFKTAVVARAQQIGLDPAFVYGLIRQESRFIMDARSTVGASGLFWPVALVIAA